MLPDADARRAAIQQRAEKASRGPWSVALCSDTDERRDIVADYKKVDGGAQAHWIAELDAQIDFDSDVETQLEELRGNADFIAHAREDIPYLLDLVARLVAEQTRLQQATDGMVEQFCRDLNGAHDEILKLQGVKAEDFNKYDWPEWSAPANSIRWAERRLGKRLAKTALWSEVPDMCRCPDTVCILHPHQQTCSLRQPAPPVPPAVELRPSVPEGNHKETP